MGQTRALTSNYRVNRPFWQLAHKNAQDFKVERCYKAFHSNCQTFSYRCFPCRVECIWIKQVSPYCTRSWHRLIANIVKHSLRSSVNKQDYPSNPPSSSEWASVEEGSRRAPQAGPINLSPSLVCSLICNASQWASSHSTWSATGLEVDCCRVCRYGATSPLVSCKWQM